MICSQVTGDLTLRGIVVPFLGFPVSRGEQYLVLFTYTVMYFLTTGPKAMRSRDHELNPLTVNQNKHFPFLNYLSQVLFSQQQKADYHAYRLKVH